MSYRQSSYDPNAWEQPGLPVRPYNWVQWTGIAFCAAGALLALWYLLGKTGLVPQILHDAFPATGLVMIGIILVYTRRMPGTQISPQERRKRLFIVGGAFAIAALAAAAVILTNTQGA